MAKFYTAFDATTTAAIETQIDKLAQNINRHIALDDVRIRDLRDVVVSPDLRGLATQAAQYYGGALNSDTYTALVRGLATQAAQYSGGALNSDTYTALVRWPRDHLMEDDVTTRFGCTSTRVVFYLRRDVFAMPDHFAKHGAELHDDTHPELVARIQQCVREWAANGIRYAFVKSVFGWVNDWVGKGNRPYARLLLPGILPLLRRGGYQDMAVRLAPAKRSNAWSAVPAHIVPALQRANEIIAAGLLYPHKNYVVSDQCAPMYIATPSTSVYPLWEHELNPILGLS